MISACSRQHASRTTAAIRSVFAQSETDWELAAKAWDDLQMIPGSGGTPGIGL